MILGIIYLMVSLLFGLLSLIIWKFKWVSLIAGYDEEKVTDKPGLAKWFGKCCLAIAVLSLSLSLLCFVLSPFNIQTAFIFGISFTFLTMFGCVVTIAGASKYLKH